MCDKLPQLIQKVVPPPPTLTLVTHSGESTDLGVVQLNLSAGPGCLGHLTLFRSRAVLLYRVVVRVSEKEVCDAIKVVNSSKK